MGLQNTSTLIRYAFFTAVATTVYFLESIAVRALPLPFLRIGLANVVIVYLLFEREAVLAFTVNILKTLIGGFASFTLISPATVLSLLGGIGALTIMWLLMQSRLGFSLIGISIAGAVTHNVVQLLCVRWILITRDSVLLLMPALMIAGIFTGLITGVIALQLRLRLDNQIYST